MTDPLLVLLGIIFLAGTGWWLFRPEKGFWSRWQETRRLSGRVRREDALKYLFDGELQGRAPSLANLAGVLHLSTNETATLLAAMEQERLLEVEQGQIRLTATGRTSAVHIIRAHRLWEQYLAEETGFTEAEWHGQADRWEHTLSPSGADALAARLGHPTHDPHGDPIPTAGGEIVTPASQSLATVPVDMQVRITHLEDEPEVVYEQLVAAGLHPGMIVRVVESTPQRVRVVSRGDEHPLAPLVAANVFVVPTPDGVKEPANGRISLAALAPGKSGEVTGLAPACRGAERRRLLDLGIIPGTLISAELRSPSGDPIAYRIRGALIALRQEQAAMIEVKPEILHAKEQE